MSKENRNDPTPVDGQVMDALQQIAADVDKACALQKTDPDGKSDPVDAAVKAGLNSLKDLVQNVIADQAKDGAADARSTFAAIREVRETLLSLRSTPAPVRVTYEPRMYNELGPHSYFRDLSAATLGLVTSVDQDLAKARLQRHAQEVDYEARSGDAHSREYHLRVLQTLHRVQDPEAQENRAAMNTTTDAAFVTPQYLIDKWITYRSADRSFTNQCTILPLPAYGMTFNIPSFTTAGAAGEQVLTGSAASINNENSGIASVTPSGADVSVVVGTFAGYVPISQQLFDRGGYEGAGGTMDSIIIQQSQSQLYASVDSYLIGQAIASATVINQSTAATITQFYLDLATLRNNLADAAGVKIPGTHLFSTSDFSGWLFSQIDTEGRPLLVPDAAAMVSRDGDDKYAGWLGVFMPGNLKYFANDNIPTAAPGANTTIIAGSPSDLLVWAGEIIPFTAQQTNAANLSVIAGLRQYVSATVRHAGAFSTLSGSGYPITLV